MVMGKAVNDPRTLRELQSISQSLGDIRCELRHLNRNFKEFTQQKLDMKELNQNLKHIAQSNDKLAKAFCEHSMHSVNLHNVIEDLTVIVKNQIARDLLAAAKQSIPHTGYTSLFWSSSHALYAHKPYCMWGYDVLDERCLAMQPDISCPSIPFPNDSLWI